MNKNNEQYVHFMKLTNTKHSAIAKAEETHEDERKDDGGK